MRKDWWILVVLVVCFVLLVGLLFFGESIKVKTQSGQSNLEERGEYFDVNPEDDGVDSVGGGSGAGVVSNDVVVGGEIVPNISSVECGFYFEEYGVCAGTCPGGECVSEGRSCYCRS